MFLMMKQTKFILLCLFILTGVFVAGLQFNQDSKLTSLEEENRLLAAENKQLKVETSYSNSLIKTNMIGDYKYWAEIEQIAEKMVDDSEGRFKKTWAIYLANEATQYEIDPFLIYELLKVETGHTFDPNLIGPETIYGHAYGMAQFMKNTAPWIADMAGLPYSEELLFDPYYSMNLAIVYLDFLHHKYDDWDQALTAYHRGMTGMENYVQRTGTAKSHYADIIQTNAKKHHTVAMAE